MRCCWRVADNLNGQSGDPISLANGECGEFASGARAMWEHIVGVHLKVPRDQETGQWLLEPKPDIDMENGDAIAASMPQTYNCHWANCNHFPTDTDSAFLAGQHVKTHLPDTSIKQAIHARHNRIAEDAQSPAPNAQNSNEAYGSTLGNVNRYAPSTPSANIHPNFRYFNTATDEANDAAGLPLSSVLVLRNLARQLNKIPPPSSVLEIPDSPSHKRTFSATEPGSPSTHRTTGGKKPRLSDAARDRALVDGEREEAEAKNVGWVPRVFAPVRDQLAFVASHNLTLKNYMGGLLKAIADGGA